MIDNYYNKRIQEIPPIDSSDHFYPTEFAIVRDREDLRKIIEAPCLVACLSLYDKNIQTVNSSANKQNIGNDACIGINYDSLDENNKKILDQLIEEGTVEPLKLSKNPNQRGGRVFYIKTPISRDDTVGKISDRLLKIAYKFEEQDVLYGRHDEDIVLANTVAKYSEFLHPDENNNVTLEDVVEVACKAFMYSYDEEAQIFWENKELYNKHKRYLKKQKLIAQNKSKTEKDK